MKNIIPIQAKYIIGILLLIYTTRVDAQRLKTSINTGWKFHKGELNGYPQQKHEDIQWEQVSIPHTWNKTDVMDDEKGYYRGVGWYTRKLFIPAAWQDKEISLYFEGASQVAEVYINGKLAGKHTGGYTGFNICLKPYLNFGAHVEIEVAVKVDNSHNADIAPLSADFTFFGGIYRDAYVLVADPVHFNLNNYGSPGVFITTPEVSRSSARVIIEGSFTNQGKGVRNIRLESKVVDQQGRLIAKQQTLTKVNAGAELPFKNQLTIQQPSLWSPDDPYLYRLHTVLTDAKTGRVLDDLSHPLGLRWFSMDAEKGFFLNGQPLKLIGASRHQDYKDMGNALPDAMHLRDVQLLKDLGANFLRVAHYPQDPAVLEACDRLGILASVETPVVNAITESAAFADNCKTMQVEMIRQNFNHPSVIIWAYMNEVLLRLPYTEGERLNAYIRNVAKLAGELELITRKEDPYRYTMIPNHGNFKLYHEAGLTRIPKIVGWNLYQGWYSGTVADFPKFLDQHRLMLPDKPMIVTEYGADVDPRIHSFNPVRFDKSEEYGLIYHKAYLKSIRERSFVAGAAIWNLADFSSEHRAESMPHINNKGIATIDRKPKAIYWYYKSQLVKKPFVAIATKGWTLRSGWTDSTDSSICTQRIDVFSNQKTVTLNLNGLAIATSGTVDGVASFQVPFVDGENNLQAIAGTATDATMVNFKLLSRNLRDPKRPFNSLNISLGDKRIITDEQLQELWLPEQPYLPGSWGYIGGGVFVIKGNSRISYGSDINILGTDDDPIFETQRTGIKQFKLDVPDGTYAVIMHFAELLSDKKEEGLVYNLSDNTGVKDHAGKRAFNVSINKLPVLEQFGNENGLTSGQAVSIKTMIDVKEGQGISIDFSPISGEAILNALQVKRIF